MPVSIKQPINAVSGGVSVYPGEVVVFAEGSVPTDGSFTQISGPVAPPSADSGVWTLETFGPKLTAVATRSRIAVTTTGRIFAHLLQTSPQAAVLQELDASYNRIGAPVAILNVVYLYGCMPIPLSDGNILCLGGNLGSGNNVVRYTVATKTFTALSNKPTGNITTPAAKAAQAGDGVVYGVFTGSQVDAFNPTSNTWTENFATAPSAGTLQDICKLPSGKLLWVFTSGQYVFDPSTKAFTSVGSYAFTAPAAAAVATATGARIYNVNATNGSQVGCVEYYDYSESTGLSSASPSNVQKAWSDASFYQVFHNPASGNAVIKGVASTASEHVLLTHVLTYTPLGTVKAIKSS